MDEHLQALIDYARDEFDEIEQLRDDDTIDDDCAFARLFLVGKSLVGWDSNKPVDEAVEFCKKINEDVMAIIDNTPQTEVS
jgi:hypothetical protein